MKIIISVECWRGCDLSVPNVCGGATPLYLNYLKKTAQLGFTLVDKSYLMHHGCLTL